MPDKDKERIKYLTEKFRLIWVSALAVGSGTLGLLASTAQSPLRAVLIGEGILAFIGLVVAIFHLDRLISAEVERGEEK